MSILRVARAAAATVGPQATVMEAIRSMQEANVGAVAVVEDGEIRGMFSERDVMLRVVLEERDPEATPVSRVMTTDVVTISRDTRSDEAVKTMWERHVRHLPVIAPDGTVEGIVEIRSLFHERFEEMSGELDSLESFVAADGIGG